MSRTRIKICGITRVEDARAAADCGANMIGMILHARAPREISLDRAREILAALPASVTPVGVFVDAGADFIRKMAADLHLAHVQLHGDESPQQVRELDGLNVFKAIQPRQRSIEDELARWEIALPALRGVLIETGRGAHAGGNGIPSDWDAIARLDRTTGILSRVSLIAAGGLDASNVASVIERVHPWAVDVSSGVESSIGIKSIEKLRAFCAAVR